MVRIRKSVVGVVSVTAAVIAIGVASCKSAGKEESSDTSGLFDSKEEKLIAEQIKSFNDTQQDLINANTRNASGCEKLDILWKKIEDTQQTEAKMMAPKGKLKEVLAFGTGSALRFWRIFEGWGQNEGGSELRPYEKNSTDFVRLTHRYGTLAKMRFVVDKAAVQKLGYTGQYAQGNDCVLGRLSSAVPTSVVDRFTPAVAAKFFTGGSNESQVLIVQHDIGGQSSGTDFTVNPPREKTPDNNFYTHYLSNRLSFEKGVYSGVGAFSRFFYTAQYFSKNVLNLPFIFDPRELQASHLAERNVDGTKVAAPKGPRFVWYTAPSDNVKANFADMAAKDRDFRKHFMSLNGNISKASPLPVFNVYASDTWTYEPEKDAVLIGRMEATTPFVVSEAADVRLFFKHSIQFRKIPELDNQPNPYTQDFAFADWNEKTFTSECRLGIRQEEILPTKEGGLSGSFVKGAVFSPKTARKSNEGKLCLFDIIEDKLEETLAPKIQNYLP